MPVLRSPGRFFFAVLLLLFSAAFARPGDEAPAGPAPEPDLEGMRRRISGEAPAELAGIRLGDAGVSLLAAGYWKGGLQGNLGLSLTPLGAGIISPDSPVLFTQEADLTLSLWILERWFVEASFLDDTDLNTYRAGYAGMPGEIIQYAGIGNTGLDFPAFPYLDLGGDSPSSFGFYGRLGGDNLTMHTLFRYDAAAREERVFVGSRERTYAYVSPQNPARGVSFVLPDVNLDAEPQVYLEDPKGPLTDNNGRRWRQAGPSEYAAGRVSGMVELSARNGGRVAAAYTRGGAVPGASMGAYNDGSGGAGISFLKAVQQYFDPSGTNIDLRDFPQCGEDPAMPDIPGTVQIGGVTALVVYEPGTFSPFERQNRYEAPSSTSAQAAMVRLSSGEPVSGWELIPLDPGAVSAGIPLYAAAGTRRALFEIVRDGASDRRGPETRWPLGEQFPRLYLPGAFAFTEDVSLRFTNYGASGDYFIGTGAVPGSVQVWRGGIQDSGVSYNASSGTVSLANPAGFNEVIRITYLKRSDERRMGSVAAGLGAVYERENSPFSSALALGIRWNLNQESSFSEEGVSNPGTVGLSAKTAWDFDYLKARAAAGLGFEQPDTTGLYRAAGMEGNEISLALPPDTAFVSQPPVLKSVSLPSGIVLSHSNRADLVYRNYRDNGSLGSPLMTIDWGGAATVSERNRPYPVRDPALSGETYVLAAEFTLDSSRQWTGFEVPLGDDAALLARAGEIEIPFRFYDFSFSGGTVPADFTLVLQIGALSGEDLSFTENAALVLEKRLYDGAWNGTPQAGTPAARPPGSGDDFSRSPWNFDGNPRIVRFVLRDEDRLKLGDAKYLRIAAVYSGSQTIRGRVLLAPPLVRGASFRPITVNGNTINQPPAAGPAVRAGEIGEGGPDSLEAVYGDTVRRLHSSGGVQRVLEVRWDGFDSAAGLAAGADGRIGALPLADYRVLSFFVRGPEESGNAWPVGGTLSFLIARGPHALDGGEDRWLEAEIPLSAFRPGKWSKVSVRYRGTNQGVLVDGGRISNAHLRYHFRRRDSGGAQEGRPWYAAVFVNPEGRNIAGADIASGKLPPAGGFRFDEIMLEEASPAYRLNLGGGLEYSRPGTLLAAAGLPVLEDFSVSTSLESEVRGDPFTAAPGDSEVSGGAVNRSNAALTLLGTKINGGLAFTAAEETFLWSAGHGVSRSWGPFSVMESFSAAPRDNSAEHRFAAGLASQFSAKFDARAFYELSRLERKWDLAAGVKPASAYIPAVSVISAAAWTEKNGSIGESENYGGIWARTWRPMLPDLGPGADSRTTRTLITISEETKPVGAVLSLEGGTGFTRAANITRSTNSARLELPVALGESSLSASMERGFKRYLRFSGTDALDEGRKFFESLNDFLPLWFQAPLYSLFAPGLNGAMDRGLGDSPSAGLAEYSSFNDRFGLSARFPGTYDLRAFFIPSSASGRIERIIEQKLDTRFDMLHIGGSLGFSAVNMLGAMGSLPLFRFYRADEFSHTIESAVAIPRTEALSWRLQSGLGAAFHGFSGGLLSLGNTLTVGSSGWLDSVRADWTAPAPKSLLGVFYRWIAAAAAGQRSWLGLSALLNAEYEQLRRESLELSFDKPDEYLRWVLSAGHESIIRIQGRLNVSVFARLDCAGDGERKTLSFAGTAGGGITVSF